MAVCEVCGNDYDKAFEVVAAGYRHKMAPICQRCSCRVVGHGVEVSGRFYCCAHCAREAEGVTQIRDRVDAPDRTG